MKRHHKALLIVALLLLGCTVRYIAEYDPIIDGNARHLQAKLDALFEDLSRTAGTPEGEYEHYAARYDAMRVDIAGLQYDAAVQSKNELTNTSLTLLDDNLHLLEAAHREGLGRAEVPVLRKLFDTQLRMIVQLETAKKRERASGGSS
ncbi:MAG: hypothetical protein ACXW5U_07245 [Thermoanaerobaculia bacterium]